MFSARLLNKRTKSRMFYFAILAVIVPISACQAQNSSPSQEKAQFPVEVRFENKSAQEVGAILKGTTILAQIDTRNPDMPNAKSTILTPSYSITRYDLNGDGVDEIFLYTSGSGMCGSSGCPLNIYQKDRDNKFVNILNGRNASVTTSQAILILKNQNNNYHDIELGKSAIWKFNGDSYKFSQAIK